MRIRPSATRSPPCLDAGRRGFAMIGSHRERIHIRHQERRSFGELTRRVNHMAATATGLIASRRLACDQTMTSSSPGFVETAIRFVAVACVCDWALPAAFPSGRSRPVGLRTLRPVPREGYPPEGPRSPRAARRGEARQGSPAAKRRARHTDIGKRPPPKRRSARPERKPDRTLPARRPRKRTKPHRSAKEKARQSVEGQPLPPVTQFGRNGEDRRQNPRGLSCAFETQGFRVQGREAPAARRAALPPKAASAGGMGAQRPCAGRFRGRRMAEAGRSAERPAKPGVTRRAARFRPRSR